MPLLGMQNHNGINPALQPHVLFQIFETAVFQTPRPLHGDLFYKIGDAYRPYHGPIFVAWCTMAIMFNVISVIVLTRRRIINTTNIIIVSIILSNIFTLIGLLAFTANRFLTREVHISPVPFPLHGRAVFEIVCLGIIGVAIVTAFWLHTLLAWWRNQIVSHPHCRQSWNTSRIAITSCVSIFLLAIMTISPCVYQIHTIAELLHGDSIVYVVSFQYSAINLKLICNINTGSPSRWILCNEGHWYNFHHVILRASYDHDGLQLRWSHQIFTCSKDTKAIDES
jgi:hypothetical protein